jgi:hypothetical protein
VNEPVVVRRGVGYRAVVVHAGDGLPPYDFAPFAPRSAAAAAEPDEPPGAGKLVF